MDDDGKLKLLWIEDRAAEYAVKLDQLGTRAGGAFEVGVLSRLDDILALRTGLSKGSKTPEFDVAVCDFNLVDGNILPDGTEAAGLKSRAAGFMIGSLLALREPNRPRGLVPYSQSKDEFGDTYRLFQSYLPSSIIVAEAFETDKADLDKAQVLIRAAETFRTSLERLSQDGKAHFSEETVRRLLAAREDPSRIMPDHLLEINYFGGSRRVLVKALFYQEYCDSFVDGDFGSLYRALHEFLGRLSFNTEDFIQARRLADRYWEKSCSAASIEAYQPSAPASGDLTGGPRARWLMTEQDFSSRIRSYAALDLLIRAYVQTNLVRSAIENMTRGLDDEQDLSALRIEAVIAPTLELVQASEQSFFAECLRGLVQFYDERSVFSVEELLDRFEQPDRRATNPDAPPSWEQRWVRALDPEPKPGEALRHSGPRGFGKTLGHHLTKQMGEPLNESIGPDLVSNSRAASLAPELVAIARLYALERIPSGLPLPLFLQRSGA